MKPLVEQNFYEILEVAPDASSEQIDQAFARAMAYYGPESLAVYSLVTIEEAQKLIRLVEDAYLVLSDAMARHAYDREHGLLSPAPAPCSVELPVPAPRKTTAWLGSSPCDDEEEAPVAVAFPAKALVPSPGCAAPIPVDASPANAAPSPLEEPTPAPSAFLEPDLAASQPAGLAQPVEAVGLPVEPARLEPRPEAAAALPVADAPSEAKDPCPEPVAGPANEQRLSTSQAELAVPAREEPPASPSSAKPLGPEIPEISSVETRAEPGPFATEGPAEPDGAPRTPAQDDPSTVEEPAEAAAVAGALLETPVTAEPIEPLPIPGAIVRSASFVAKAREREPAPPSSPSSPSKPPSKSLEVPPDAVFNGELLRRIRGSKGLSPRELADHTKIGLAHIENIEADHYGALPVTVYLRGFLMSIARELKLDPLKVSKSYLELVIKAKQKG
ncbi:MAG: helix-turn-helix domain-containing protein [Deltaproteobacteria bacterium]|nr:helix-turn-helix domain-containing protein [Deltaproteobacteria bacterium]